MADVNYIQCPSCLKTQDKLDSVIKITDNFTIYHCYNCNNEFAVRRNKMTQYVVIRDDNNRLMTTVEQATHVAEKLARESNDGHSYFVAKLIKKSSLANVVTVDLE